MRIRKYFTIKNILLIILASAAFSGCSQVADLSEYQGINYVESLVFDPAIEVNWDRDTTDTYLVFTAVVPSTTSGLPAGTSDYSRLEVLNLMPDGGFENGIGDWTPVLSGGSANVVAGDTETIHSGDNSLKYDLGAEERVDFDLDNLNGGITDNANYLIRFKFNMSGANLTAVFEYNDGANAYDGGIWTPKTDTAWTGNGYTEFRTSAGEESIITAKTGAPGNDIFSIGSINDLGDSQEGHIDDVRIVRTDISLCLRAVVPYEAQDRPDLVSGNYKFSIYVKKEDAADINPSTADTPDSENRFPSQEITLCINSNPTVIDVSAVTDSAWEKVSAELFIQIDKDESIQLSVSPINITSPYLKDAGSILIASPALYFISD